jgi:preprotein translocase subunit SecA
VRHLSKYLPIGPASAGYRKTSIDWINSRRGQLDEVSDEDLKAVARDAHTLPETFAVTAVLAERLLGFKMFDVQLHCALALADGKIAEMHTGEGKTLSAAAAVAWLARAGNGVHVMTVNDYLARRDAKWMKPIYAFFGLSVGCIQQNMDCRQRKQAYACDITYATANEIGFRPLSTPKTKCIDRSRQRWSTRPTPSLSMKRAFPWCSLADSQRKLR